ncbi:MAG: L,D-transpeptidase family protein [Chthoniobacter sp.]|nr:L,D-transpeptidase family protein [Chthoniobacter sp.]
MRFAGYYKTLLAVLFCTFGVFEQSASAQLFGSRNPGPPMKKPADLIHRGQAPAKVDKSLESTINPDNSHVIVSLGKQRVYLMVGEQIYIDSPISSGKRGHETPKGDFHVLEKDPDHHSSIYGDFVDRSGRVVRSGVSTQIDSAPSGTHYQGASMKWFCRLTQTGVGMHVGILPGYAASHGCVRLPSDIAPLIYQKVKVGTPAVIED